MTTLSELMGMGSGGATLGPRVSTPFFTSGTWAAPQDGVLEIRGMGAGGGGCRAASGSGTGGYSGAWGAKLVRVKKSDVVTVTLGAGGTGTVSNANGTDGGACTITVGGVTYTAPGGLGGRYAATGVPVLPAAPVLPTNWDIGANSVKPGAAVGRTGGAGVNILAQAGDATTSASLDLSGGGGTGAASSSVDGGGASPGGRSASGALPTKPGVIERADNGEWIISFFGGGGGGYGSSGGNGGNGGGGGGGNGGIGGGGGNGGGGGGTSGSYGGGNGGIGGGGGNGGGGGGGGGNAYACLHFYADTGV